MKVKIFGDSHVKALSRGWEHLKSSGGIDTNLHFDFYASDGRYWLDCSMTETATSFRLGQERQGGKLLDDYVVEKNSYIYVFSSPLHSAPLYRNRVWKTFCPWMCAARNPDLQALSSNVIERWADQQVRHRIKMIDRLRAGGVSMIVVEPPKPLKRTPKMFGIRADVLSATSKIYRNYVSKLLEDKGISIIRVPPDTYEETGFTKSKFAPKNFDDYHHGNLLFGCAVMKEIVEYVDQ